MPRRQPRSVPRVAGVVVAGLCAVVLAACTPSPSTSSEPSTVPSADASVAPSAPSGPVLVPEGSADDNLPLFTAITQQVWGTDQKVSGRAYIDALVAAGFDKADMQVTEDLSTVGNPAESIQFSVRWTDGSCLIGQVGPSTGDPVTAVMAELSGGRCLIGNTRDIDW